MIPPGRDPVSSWYEQWTGGGCTHRCDGVTNVITDSACSCSPENRACKATTRVNVMLPDLPDIGVWRLESHGINAAMELPGTIGVIQMASDTGRFLPGRLRIEQRMSKKDGRTNRFSVPVIDLDVTSRALMSGEAPALDATEVRAIESGAEAHAVPEQPVEGVAPSAGGRVESPESAVVGSAGPGDSPATISQKQINKMMAVANDNKISTDELKEIVADLAGVRSRKEIPAAKFDLVLAGIQNMGELKSMEGGK
jgi:hypothetical protein